MPARSTPWGRRARHSTGYRCRAYSKFRLRCQWPSLAPAIRAAVADPGGGEEPSLELEKFTGLYSRPFGTESAVLTWEGQLVVVGLPTSNPVSAMTKLKHIEGSSFRRIRSDGDLGEEYLFEETSDGTMTYWVHNNPRVRTSRLPRQVGT